MHHDAGNTCFMNAALQCLRYTPDLPMMLIPGILEHLPAPGSAAAIALSTEHPPLPLPEAAEVAPIAQPPSIPSLPTRTPLGGGIPFEDSTSAMLSFTSHPSSSGGSLLLV